MFILENGIMPTEIPQNIFKNMIEHWNTLLWKLRPFVLSILLIWHVRVGLFKLYLMVSAIFSTIYRLSPQIFLQRLVSSPPDTSLHDCFINLFYQSLFE